MLRIALTGGIATGKSYVLARLRDRGIPTIDADDLVHAGFEPGTAITRAVSLAFGDAVLQPDGRIDRAALASTVFADADARLRLEAIVHPVVYEKVREWFDTLNRPLAVASIPLLYETGHESDFDAVVATACTADQQLRRIMDRGLSEEDARRRIAAQMPTEEKTRRADYVIWTSATLAETDEQIEDLLAKLADRR